MKNRGGERVFSRAWRSSAWSRRRPSRRAATAASRWRPHSSPAQLTALPADNWVTNGGNLYNQRYSPLTQINRDNVKQLKGLWRASMGSGAGPGTAGQAQILEYEGDDLRAERRERRVRDRRGNGPHPLDVSRQSRSEGRQPDRQGESRCRARRRQGVRRPHGRAARRARSEERAPSSGKFPPKTGSRASPSRPRRCTTTAS